MSEFEKTNTSAVVLAAGEGKRAGAEKEKQPKQFRNLAGIPLLAHCLKVFEKNPQISEIIIAAPAGQTDRAVEIADTFGISKTKIIAGGKNRFESARMGFKETGEDAHLVLFHDAARPFVDNHIVNSCIRVANRFGAATTAIPLDDSIKKTAAYSESGKLLKETISRDGIWRAQTPQVFQKKPLACAYKNFSGNPADVNDEAALFEAAGHDVIVIPGARRNMKITTEEDFLIAKALAEAWRI